MLDHEFERGMKLEAVNPNQPNQICVATITRLVEHLMWLHLDGIPGNLPNHIVDTKSFSIFPVGWCESNGYPLKAPRKKRPGRQVAVVQPEYVYLQYIIININSTKPNNQYLFSGPNTWAQMSLEVLHTVKLRKEVCIVTLLLWLYHFLISSTCNYML